MPSPSALADLSLIQSDIAADQPIHVWIEPTNRCNTRCAHCHHYYSHFGEDMPPELYRKIADSAIGAALHVDLIGYGEPLISLAFDQMFEEMSAQKRSIGFTTNGIALKSDAAIQRFMRDDVTLTLSVDGVRAETFEFVRRTMKWERMQEVLGRIERLMNAAPPGKRMHLRFNYVAMKKTIGDLPDIIRLAVRCGAEEVSVLPLAGQDVMTEVSGQSLADSPEMVAGPFLEAVRIAREKGVWLRVAPWFRDLILRGLALDKSPAGRWRQIRGMAQLGIEYWKRAGLMSLIKQVRERNRPLVKAARKLCLAPWRDAYFAADGSVFPCCIIVHKLGDMNSASWPEIWNSPAYRGFRRILHSWNPSECCRFCILPQGINGGEEHYYGRLFSKYRAVAIALDSPQAAFGEGFYNLENLPDGKPSHRWMKRSGVLEVSGASPRTKFIRLRIIPAAPVPEMNYGACRINGAAPEPFDNSCGEINFPVHPAPRDRIRIELEMEKEHDAPPPDTRRLGLAISGIELLSDK